MTKTLILIRHGNTFDKGDVILRVGCRTDMPLSSSGRMQAEKLGPHLRHLGYLPGLVYVSPLRRTQETAQIALSNTGCESGQTIHSALNEIDYGPDEGRPEEDVIARLGADALQRWETEMTMPDGWSPRPDALRAQAARFREELAVQEENLIWAVTSNGVARFIAEECVWDCLRPDTLKLSTAGYSVLAYENGRWHVRSWNQKAA